jgi:hypothetical protein
MRPDGKQQSGHATVLVLARSESAEHQGITTLTRRLRHKIAVRQVDARLASPRWWIANLPCLHEAGFDPHFATRL